MSERQDGMTKLLIVVDMQNDFITGSLGSPQAERIVPDVKAKIEEYKRNGNKVIFTRDTHYDGYLTTQEGRHLPVPHCIHGTQGHLTSSELDADGCEVFDKTSFGSLELAKKIAGLAQDIDEIELCGLCTDICVVSNALILKAQLPETKVTVDARCCAGVTENSHKAALLTMKMCQVNVINEE
ncbi:MAG: cysteine hydrolase [Synergistaceae bacterium]|nr:cysteine hydrolase [Synergistaceae bacterium]